MNKNNSFIKTNVELIDEKYQDSTTCEFEGNHQSDPSFPTDSSLEKLLDRDDMVKMFNVSYVTLRSWEKNGSIPKPIRVGKRVYWQKAKIISFISSGKTNFNL